MLVRNWKHPWLLLCPAKLLGAIRIVGVVHPIKSKQTLACILAEASESTRLRMGGSLPIHHEDHIAGKEILHYSIIIWFTNLFPCLKL